MEVRRRNILRKRALKGWKTRRKNQKKRLVIKTKRKLPKKKLPKKKLSKKKLSKVFKKKLLKKTTKKRTSKRDYSLAAKKGWETRRKKAAKRSEAALKGWVTRRRKVKSKPSSFYVPKGKGVKKPKKKTLSEKLKSKEKKIKTLEQKLDKLKREKSIREIAKEHPELVKDAHRRRIQMALKKGNVPQVVREIWFEWEDFDVYENEREIWEIFEEDGGSPVTEAA